jgi:hypothetical protein
MQKKIKVEYIYRNDLTHDDHPRIYTKEMIDSYFLQIKQKQTFYYGATDACLYKALEQYSINGKKVAIIGSQCPLYESICLFYGGVPTTFDYQKIISEDDRLTAITVKEYEGKPILFDAAFSISSFEHDGLGRYGDPTNPDGDLQAMAKMKSVIKKGGLLFLSVPVGRDKLVWNLYRIYGNLRLQKLLSGWKILNIYHHMYNWQPVFVLQNSDAGRYNLDYFLGMMEAIDTIKQVFSPVRCWIRTVVSYLARTTKGID